MIGAVFPFVVAGLTSRGSRKAAKVLVNEVQNLLRDDESIAR